MKLLREDLRASLRGLGDLLLLLFGGRRVDYGHRTRTSNASKDVLRVVEGVSLGEAARTEVIVGAAGALVTDAEDGLTVSREEMPSQLLTNEKRTFNSQARVAEHGRVHHLLLARLSKSLALDLLDLLLLRLFLRRD